MKKNKIPLRIFLIGLAGISCSFLSRIITIPTPTQEIQTTLYSLNDALTLAGQTLEAENYGNNILTPTINPTVILTQSPTPLSAISQYSILGEHHVAPGETLSCIGRGYCVMPKAIADANGIELISELQPGQILQIPDVKWTNMTTGPICPPQFTHQNCNLEADGQTDPTENSNYDDNADISPATQPNIIQPPKPTEPKDPGGITKPTAKPTKENITLPPICLPPNCSILPTIIIIDPPTDPPPVGPTEPPTDPPTEPPILISPIPLPCPPICPPPFP